MSENLVEKYRNMSDEELMALKQELDAKMKEMEERGKDIRTMMNSEALLKFLKEDLELNIRHGLLYGEIYRRENSRENYLLVMQKIIDYLKSQIKRVEELSEIVEGEKWKPSVEIPKIENL